MGVLEGLTGVKELEERVEKLDRRMDFLEEMCLPETEEGQGTDSGAAEGAKNHRRDCRNSRKEAKLGIKNPERARAGRKSKGTRQKRQEGFVSEGLRMVEKIRKTGIDIIGDAPWGTHLCQFYRSKEDLIDILVPYFRAGLENNEFCIWVTSEPLSEEEAIEAMRRAVPHFDRYLKGGQIEILDYREWYTKSGKFEASEVLQGWVEKEKEAVKMGFDGLRLTGNTFWLGKRDWRNFADYEEEINRVVGNYRMIAICSYSLDKCNASEIIDVVSNHQFALIRREGEWKLIESSERKQAEGKIKSAAEAWKLTFDSITDLVGILDKDFRFVRVNKAYSDVFKMEPREFIGRACYEVVHGAKEPWPDCPVKKALETKKPASAEFFEPRLGIPLEISVSPIFDGDGEVDAVLHIAKDITERKRAEEALRESEEKVNSILSSMVDLVFVFDKEGRFTLYHSPSKAELYLPPEKFLGKKHSKVMPSDIDKLFSEAFNKNKKGEAGEYEYSLEIGGETKYFSVKLSPIFLDSEFTGSVAVVRDITERKKTEEALRESEIKFRGFVENLDGIAVRGDMEGKPEFLIGKLENITDYTWEEFSKKGLKWFDIMHPDDKKELVEKGLKDAASGKPVDQEYRIVRKEGSIRWVSQRISPQMKEDGTPEFLQGVIMDITERKRAEEALQESEEHYRTIFESAPVGIFQSTPEGKLINSNPATARIFGYESPDELMAAVNKSTIAEALYVHPEKRPPILDKALEQGGWTLAENQYRRKDGNTLTGKVIFQVVRNPDGTSNHLEGFIEDITDRKRAEDQIKRRLKFEKTISDISSRFVGVSKIDNSINASLADMGKLSGAGRAYLFLLNKDGATMDNTHEWCAEGVSPQIDNLKNLPCEMFPWWMDKLLKGETIHIMDVSRLPTEAKAEKKTLEAQDIKSLLVLPLHVGRKLAGFIGFDNVRETGEWSDDDLALLRTSSEIIGSAIKRTLAEELISKQIGELKKLDKMKSEFLSVVSHELKAPLTPIQGYIDLLKSGEYGGLNYEQNKALDICMESSKRLKSMIDNLVEITRLESGNVKLSTEKMNLTTLTESVLDEFKPTADEKNIRITYNKRVPSVTLTGDKDKLRTVISNLVGNAIKFTPDGSRVLISLKEGKRTIHFKVKDSGVGIPEEHQSRIFDKFYQADTSASREFGGMGLGLAICKEIIDLHGGSIWAKSKPGKGSEFHFTIPVR